MTQDFLAMKLITLQTARERAGMRTQTELAERSGVDISTISRLEAGINTNPSFATVRKLEAALRLKRGTLAFGPMEPEAQAS